MMEKYHKIQSIYKRGEKNKFIIGDWSTPEIELLQNCLWQFTEKVDGTNIRVDWKDGVVEFGGREEFSQIPVHLLKVLMEKFHEDTFKESDLCDVTLYGEGYGHKIQSGGNYQNDKSTSFVLFDVRIAGFWLKREDVIDVANKLNIEAVPIIGKGTIHDGIEMVKKGLQSQWGHFIAEGIVARPMVDLFARNGDRIITKIKGKDFK